jgi:hypothetical protein
MPVYAWHLKGGRQGAQGGALVSTTMFLALDCPRNGLPHLKAERHRKAPRVRITMSFGPCNKAGCGCVADGEAPPIMKIAEIDSKGGAKVGGVRNVRERSQLLPIDLLAGEHRFQRLSCLIDDPVSRPMIAAAHSLGHACIASAEVGGFGRGFSGWSKRGCRQLPFATAASQDERQGH